MNVSLLARLEHQPDALRRLLSGLSENQIWQRPTPDKWSILENIAHPGRYQHVFRERMTLILEEEKPGFNRYVADNDPGFKDWLIKPYDKLLNDLKKDREAILLFANHLSDDDWLRVGLHPAYGSMTMEGWTEFFLLHEAHHFLTILKLAGPMRNDEMVTG